MAREIANERVEEEELREFARAGERPLPADPAFEEGLREKLWRMLRERLARGRAAGDRLD